MDEVQRGHTYVFYCNYKVDGQYADPTPTGSSTTKVYRRDELIATLTTEKIEAGKYKAKWSVPVTSTLEEHYVEWSWSDGDPIKGRYKFLIVHTGIND